MLFIVFLCTVSPPYTIVRELSDQVINGLSREPMVLAYTLLGKGLLSHEKVVEITQIPATDRQRAQKIYDIMLERIQNFPCTYHKFKSVFEENPVLYSDLLEQLNTKEAEIGRSCCQYHAVYMYTVKCLSMSVGRGGGGGERE